MAEDEKVDLDNLFAGVDTSSHDYSININFKTKCDEAYANQGWGDWMVDNAGKIIALALTGATTFFIATKAISHYQAQSLVFQTQAMHASNLAKITTLIMKETLAKGGSFFGILKTIFGFGVGFLGNAFQEGLEVADIEALIGSMSKFISDNDIDISDCKGLISVAGKVKALDLVGDLQGQLTSVLSAGE